MKLLNSQFWCWANIEATFFEQIWIEIVTSYYWGAVHSRRLWTPIRNRIIIPHIFSQFNFYDFLERVQFFGSYLWAPHCTSDFRALNLIFKLLRLPVSKMTGSQTQIWRFLNLDCSVNLIDVFSILLAKFGVITKVLLLLLLLLLRSWRLETWSLFEVIHFCLMSLDIVNLGFYRGGDWNFYTGLKYWLLILRGWLIDQTFMEHIDACITILKNIIFMSRIRYAVVLQIDSLSTGPNGHIRLHLKRLRIHHLALRRGNIFVLSRLIRDTIRHLSNVLHGNLVCGHIILPDVQLLYITGWRLLLEKALHHWWALLYLFLIHGSAFIVATLSYINDTFRSHGIHIIRHQLILNILELLLPTFLLFTLKN